MGSSAVSLQLPPTASSQRTAEIVASTQSAQRTQVAFPRQTGSGQGEKHGRSGGNTISKSEVPGGGRQRCCLIWPQKQLSEFELRLHISLLPFCQTAFLQWFLSVTHLQAPQRRAVQLPTDDSQGHWVVDHGTHYISQVWHSEIEWVWTKWGKPSANFTWTCSTNQQLNKHISPAWVKGYNVVVFRDKGHKCGTLTWMNTNDEP